MHVDKKKLLLLLRMCSKRGDIRPWNIFRQNNPRVEIDLSGLSLSNLNLNKIDLSNAKLNGTRLIKTRLKKSNFSKSELHQARLIKSDMRDAKLNEVILRGGNLRFADLKGADLSGADLYRANLSSARLSKTNIEKASLFRTDIFDTDLKYARVNSETYISPEQFSKSTDFTGVGLDSVLICPRIKEGLKDIIRKKKWEEWWNEGPFWKKILFKFIVMVFWYFSDFGGSTKRLVSTLAIISILFSMIYAGSAIYDFHFNDNKNNPGIINNLYNKNILEKFDNTGKEIDYFHLLIRSVYFSIVTMTTLGFGDMSASEVCPSGHIFLIIQVTLGYFLLGAIITRFAILFSGGGPARKPSKRHDNIQERFMLIMLPIFDEFFRNYPVCVNIMKSKSYFGVYYKLKQVFSYEFQPQDRDTKLSFSIIKVLNLYKKAQGCCGLAFSEEKPIMVDLTKQSYKHKYNMSQKQIDETRDIKWIISVPIFKNRKVIGVLNLDTYSEKMAQEWISDQNYLNMTLKVILASINFVKKYV